jgi:putative transposase
MRRIEEPGRVRFITFSCHQRLSLLKNRAICRVVLDSMEAMRADYGVRIHAWVIMPEHIHLLATPGADGLAIALKAMKGSVAKRVINRWKHLDAPVLDRITTPAGALRFWQKGGGFDRNVRSLDELRREIWYIHCNPVERGLVHQPEDWEWSSIRWWMGSRESEFPCDFPPGDQRSWSAWTGYV